MDLVSSQINWINGHTTNEFKCLVNHCGIFSQLNMHAGTEEMYFTEWEMGGAPWDAAASATYEACSPGRFAAQWKTPTMVIHGGKDFRVPYLEGLQTFAALQVRWISRATLHGQRWTQPCPCGFLLCFVCHQRRGIPSELLFFPEEGHWVLNSRNSVTWHKEVIQWLSTWLQNKQV